MSYRKEKKWRLVSLKKMNILPPNGLIEHKVPFNITVRIIDGLEMKEKFG